MANLVILVSLFNMVNLVSLFFFSGDFGISHNSGESGECDYFG